MRTLARIGFTAFLSYAALAQSREAATEFSTADIQASGPNTILQMRSQFLGGRYELRQTTLVDLIRTAWGVDADNVMGGPDWLDTNRFDVVAHAPANSTPEDLRMMLRGLMADRFHLVAHADTRNLPAYAITAGKMPHLKKAEGSEETGCKADAGPGPLLFECRDMSMAAFAAAVPGMRGVSDYLFNYPVVDRTGLSGAWDFSVKWSVRSTGQPGSAPADAITIFDAFEKQLGLKLAMTRIPTPVVVVDSVRQEPTANLPGVTGNPAPPLEFEVADIKPDDSNFQGAPVWIQPGGLVRIITTLKGMIREAWGNMNPDRIVGGPELRNSVRFMVTAKAPPRRNSPEGIQWPMFYGVDLDSMRVMLRALLVERFRLETHTEDRLIPGYALVAAKPKLRKADPANHPGCKEGPGADGKDPRLANPMASRLVTCRNMTLARFIAELNDSSERNPILINFPPVVNETGIAGRYDMTINFTPPYVIDRLKPQGAAGEGAAALPDGTLSIFEALYRQLGLKLESRKVMAPVLVVDHLNEMPTAN